MNKLLGCSQAGEVVFAHIVTFAISSGRMPFLTTGHLTTLPSVDPLALGRQTPIPPDLLVVTKTETLGDLRFAAVLNRAAAIAFVIFPLWREPAMPANLLIMPRTIPTGTRWLITPLGLTHGPPFSPIYSRVGREVLEFDLAASRRRQRPSPRRGAAAVGLRPAYRGRATRRTPAQELLRA